MLCDLGVEVTRAFQTAGAVYAVERPKGEDAVAVHCGPDKPHESDPRGDLKNGWRGTRGSSLGAREIYGDPTPDPANPETAVVYLLK